MKNEASIEKNLKVVISPVVAAELCSLGYKIVKLKPKHNTNGKDTVFVFEMTGNFINDFNNVIKKYK